MEKLLNLKFSTLFRLIWMKRKNVEKKQFIVMNLDLVKYAKYPSRANDPLLTPMTTVKNLTTNLISKTKPIISFK